jgi:hypothetical protein
MIMPDDSSRRKWFMAGSVLLLLAIAVPWAISRGGPRGPDDPEELLRRATGSNSAAVPKPTGKTIKVEGVSSSGAPVHAGFEEVREGSGRVGYGVHLAEPLKEGETATMKMPGGGTVTIRRPREGEDPRQAPKAKDAGSP